MENTNDFHLPAGSLLQGGKYRITRFIGSGGFGCTYEAVHVMLEKRVAVKEFFVKDFCNRDGSTSRVSVGTRSKKPLAEKLKRKFVEEARSVCRLHHPHIVQVTDVFEENGTAYYVMDYIEGLSLQTVVEREGRLPERLALGYIRQVADALGYIHGENRLHLDVKPGNIMVDCSGNSVLIDFGASKQYDEENGENTSTLVGKTPGYAPLEQMSNRVTRFSPATDIYALGATLYKLLSGVTPPDAAMLASGGEVLSPLPLTVSGNTRRAVNAAMSLKKDDRPQSMGDFLRILDGGRPVKSEAGQGGPSGGSRRPGDDSTVLDKKEAGGRSEGAGQGGDTGRSGEGWGGNGNRGGMGGNGVGNKGGKDGKVPSSRFKGLIIAACIVIGLVAGFFLLKGLISGGGQDGGMSNEERIAALQEEIHIKDSIAAVKREQRVKDSIAFVQRRQHIRDSVAAAKCAEQQRAEEQARKEAERREQERLEKERKEQEISVVTSNESCTDEINYNDLIIPEDEVIEEAIPFFIVEEKPTFQGGDANTFRNWVSSQLVYPKKALENGIQGTVLLQFDIDRNGNIINVKVLRGVDKTLDDEAVRVVSSSPKWSPGRQGDMPVVARYQFPIEFQLR